jgi:F-type H+-transporting ATPase subunit alpha
LAIVKQVKLPLQLIQLLTKKTENLVCVYVAIGQKASSVASIVTTLEEKGALPYTILVVANAD